MVEKIKERIEELVQLLVRASESYYNTGMTIMEDAEFDRLMDELRDLEKKTGYILKNSPTQNVGATAIDGLIKIRHSFPMLSLDKCHTVTELNQFIGNRRGLLMMKMDGLSIRATYEDGKLQRLETRGDGIEGNDVTHLKKSFCDLSNVIKYKGKYEIDGECIITYDDFQKINEKLPAEIGKYANPRNLASGTLSAHDYESVKDRPLRFVAWRVITGLEGDSLDESLTDAEELGFTVVPHFVVNPENINDLPEMLDTLRSHAKELGYPIDGCVLAVDSISEGYAMGRTDKFFRHSIAYKFEDNRYPTKVTGINWTMGKSGQITPTLVFEPVEIEGTMVSKASLHNVTIMKQLSPTMGCTAYIYKANQIIPQCDSCDNDGRGPFQIPRECPECGGPVEIVKENDSEVLMCKNPDCNGKLLKRLSHFVGKQGFDITGLSEAILHTLIAEGFVADFSDIFKLGSYYSDMTSIRGMGVRSVQKLLKAIDDSRTIAMDKFLCALSIPMVGKKVSTQIADVYGYDWDSFVSDLSAGNTVKLHEIEGVGEIVISNIIEWFKGFYNSEDMYNLLTEIHFLKPNKATKLNNNTIEEKTVCITGKLFLFKNREELSQRLAEIGWKEASGVSSKIDYLVSNDKNSGSSKNKKAATLGIPVISEDELVKLIGLPGKEIQS